MIGHRAKPCQIGQEKEFGSMSIQHDQDDSNSKDSSLRAYDQYSRWVRWTPCVSKEEIASLMQGVLRGKEERSKGSPDRQILEAASQAREQIVIALQRLV